MGCTGTGRDPVGSENLLQGQDFPLEGGQPLAQGSQRSGLSVCEDARTAPEQSPEHSGLTGPAQSGVLDQASPEVPSLGPKLWFFPSTRQGAASHLGHVNPMCFPRPLHPYLEVRTKARTFLFYSPLSKPVTFRALGVSAGQSVPVALIPHQPLG